MSDQTDVVSAYVLNQIARDSGLDTRPGKRVAVRIDARCNLAEAGQFIRSGVGEYVVHVDDMAALESLREDYMTASETWERTPSKPAINGPAEDGRAVKRTLSAPRLFTEAEVHAYRETKLHELSRTPGGPSGVSYEEAFFAVARRSMKPIISMTTIEPASAQADAQKRRS